MTPGTVVPMNCIDKVLLSYEVGHQRMTFHLILSVRGHIEPDRLREALLSVLRLHPTMRTTICRSVSRSVRRIQGDCADNILEVSKMLVVSRNEDGDQQERQEKVVSEWINRPLDPSKEIPVRVLLLDKGETEGSLIFTFHHSAIDGLRAIKFIEEVLERYDRRDPFESALSADLPMQRNGDELMALARSERRRTPRFRRQMLYYMFRFLFVTPFHRSARIYNHGRKPSAMIDFCTGRVKPEAFQEMKSRSKPLGATANDVLMAAAFRAIDGWNELHGKVSGKLSLMVPVSVADEERQNLAANLVSFISVCTYSKDRNHPTRLLHKVSRESAYALKHSRGSTFAYIYFTYVLSRFPLAVMRAFARRIKFPIYADTVLHSNLGVVRLGVDDRPKGYRIMDFTAVPPVVDVMGMFLCISTYADTLGVCLAYNTGCFSKAEAQSFLGLYLEELENYRQGLQPQDGLAQLTVARSA